MAARLHRGLRQCGHAAMLALLLAGCGRQQPAAPADRATAKAAERPPQPLSPRAALGRQLFFDVSLSASGRQSCASCHDPAHAYAPANTLAVQQGGTALDQPGTRAVPSLMYKEFTLAYSDHYENPDNASPPAPGGGFGWDGRAATLSAQVVIPLTSANEMGNVDQSAFAARLAGSALAPSLQAQFGPAVFDDPAVTLVAIGEALEAFQREDASFHPYRSTFDRYRNNKVGGTLSAAAVRGLAAFVDPERGNCAACHLLGSGNGGSHDMTSDYSFAAIGVPRNAAIPANADPAYFDLGLCGPLRQDHLPRGERDPQHHCGLFKTPSLRNVATRAVFMHNGVFTSLRKVLQFYATRDTDPARWYPLDARGQIQKFDDLPPRYRDSLDHQKPLDQRAAGGKPALSDAEIDDLLTFLDTLTDDGMVSLAAEQR